MDYCDAVGPPNGGSVRKGELVSEKLVMLAILPAVTLVIMLGWIWLLTTGRQSIKMSLKGFGLTIELATNHKGTVDAPVSNHLGNS